VTRDAARTVACWGAAVGTTVAAGLKALWPGLLWNGMLRLLIGLVVGAPASATSCASFSEHGPSLAVTLRQHLKRHHAFLFRKL
jgi:hypothetical protein